MWPAQGRMSQISVETNFFREVNHFEWFGAKKKSKKFDQAMALFLHYGLPVNIVSFEQDFSGIVPNNNIFHIWEVSQ